MYIKTMNKLILNVTLLISFDQIIGKLLYTINKYFFYYLMFLSDLWYIINTGAPISRFICKIYVELINELNNWRCDNERIDKIRAVSDNLIIFLFSFPFHIQ